MDFITDGLFYGFCYGIAAVGISLPLRFLGTADFTSIGSYMLGGILSIYFTNITNCWFLGLLMGSILTGFLGIITAFMALSKSLRLSLMLSGIITFTAARSFGLIFASNGKIVINENLSPFTYMFSWSDIAILLGFALFLIIIFHILNKSKLGSLAFGLCSNIRFITFRHSMSRSTTYWIMFISNMLVGLSGGLASFKMGNAYPEIGIEFLSISFGAIFAGNAFVKLTLRVLNKRLPELPIDEQVEHQDTEKGFWEEFRLKLSPQRDDTQRMWYIFSSYFISAIILNDISTAVASQKLFNISPEFEHLIVALLILIGLFISNFSLKKRSPYEN